MIRPGTVLFLYSNANLEGGANATFFNYGTFFKWGGSGLSEVDVQFRNAGLINVITGTLRLNENNPGRRHSGDFLVSSGAVLQLSSDQEFGSTSQISGDGDVLINSGTSIISGTHDISGLTEVAGGTLDLDDASSVTFGELNQTSGNLYLDTAASIAGDFTRTGGNFNAGASGILAFTGTTQQLNVSNLTTFQDLSVSNGTTLIETNPADNCVVNGSLTNDGIIRKSQSVVTGTVSYGMTGVQMDVTTLGTLSSVTVDRLDIDHPNATGGSGGNGISTGRYWTISVTGTGYTLTLTLPHANLPEPKVCRYTGSGQVWECDRTSYDANTVTWAGRTTLSDWAVGTNVGPTAIHLVQISAAPSAEGPFAIGFLILAALLLAVTFHFSRRSAKRA